MVQRPRRSRHLRPPAMGVNSARSLSQDRDRTRLGTDDDACQGRSGDCRPDFAMQGVEVDHPRRVLVAQDDESVARMDAGRAQKVERIGCSSVNGAVP